MDRSCEDNAKIVEMDVGEPVRRGGQADVRGAPPRPVLAGGDGAEPAGVQRPLRRVLAGGEQPAARVGDVPELHGEHGVVRRQGAVQSAPTCWTGSPAGGGRARRRRAGCSGRRRGRPRPRSRTASAGPPAPCSPPPPSSTAGRARSSASRGQCEKLRRVPFRVELIFFPLCRAAQVRRGMYWEAWSDLLISPCVCMPRADFGRTRFNCTCLNYCALLQFYARARCNMMGF
jgi:hypothetical protein